MGDQLPSNDLHACGTPGSLVDGRPIRPEASFWRQFSSRNDCLSLVIAGGRGLGLGVDCNQWLARIWLSGPQHDGAFLSGNSYRYRFVDWLQCDARSGFVLLYEETTTWFVGMFAAASTRYFDRQLEIGARL